MKKSPLLTILLAVLTVFALVSLWLSWSYISNVRELRRLQAEAAMANNSRALINALINESLEYSKKNQAIDPLLESLGIKPGKSSPAAPAGAPTTAPTTAKPAAK